MGHKKKAPARKKRLKTLLKAESRKLFGEEDVKMILSHHVSRGLTASDIASKYGSTVVSVRDWLRKLGLTPKSTKPDVTERLRRLGYPSWDDFFRRNMTMTHMDAATMLDCHWTTVSAYRRLWVEGRKI
jgi:hypothetical protein